MDRRSFLGALGAASAFAMIPAPSAALPTLPARPEPDLDSAASWIVHRDGRYVLFVPRAEMGQNISTAMKMIACAELGVAWRDLDVSYGDTSSVAPYRATVGSESIQEFALPLAQACAALREAVAEGRSGEAKVRPRPASELRAFREGAMPVRPPLVGGEAIVSGGPLFAADVRLPGMLFGRVLRSDVSPEIASRPSRWNAAAARDQAGFVALVEGRELALNKSAGLGVVAATPGALDRIEAALAVEWSVDRRPDQAEVDAMVDVDRRIADGDARYDLASDRLDDDAPWDVDLRIDTPLAAHGPIEPRAAVADIAKRGGRVWVGSQDPFFARDAIADRLGLDEGELAIVPSRVGGGFGGKVCLLYTSPSPRD